MANVEWIHRKISFRNMYSVRTQFSNIVVNGKSSISLNDIWNWYIIMFYKADILQGPKDRYPYKKLFDLHVCCLEEKKNNKKTYTFLQWSKSVNFKKNDSLLYSHFFCIKIILNWYMWIICIRTLPKYWNSRSY